MALFFTPVYADDALSDAQLLRIRPATCAAARALLCTLLSHQELAQAVVQSAELAEGEHAAGFVCATCGL